MHVGVEVEVIDFVVVACDKGSISQLIRSYHGASGRQTKKKTLHLYTYAYIVGSIYLIST